MANLLLQEVAIIQYRSGMLLMESSALLIRATWILSLLLRGPQMANILPLGAKTKQYKYGRLDSSRTKEDFAELGKYSKDKNVSCEYLENRVSQTVV